jgi:hypothetical protein
MPTIIEMTAIEANSSGISDVTQTNVIQATSTSGESLKSLTNRLRIKSELVFFSQVIVVYIVVCMCLYNLTTGHGDSNLWSALLSGSLGYLLPNPKISAK